MLPQPRGQVPLRHGAKAGRTLPFIDVGEGPTALLLHGNPSWAYLYRHMIRGLAVLHQVQKLPAIRRVGTIRRMARLFDLALDSKDDAIIRAVTESANVEVYAVKLNHGKLRLRDPRDIPAALRAGASLESWVFTTYRKFG